MMPAKNLVGVRFSKAVAISRIGQSKGGLAKWLCVCDCGKQFTSLSTQLRSGTAKSCGCLRNGNPTHGMRNTREYKSWLAMKQRCNNPNNKDYARYGGRGISFCTEWLLFEQFYSDMGNRPSRQSLDRINNDGNYQPDNCRWATDVEQAANRRKPVSKMLGNRWLLATPVNRMVTL